MDEAELQRAVGRLEQSSVNADNQRKTIFEKLDQQAKDQRQMHAETHKVIQQVATDIGASVAAAREERMQQLGEVSDRVTALEKYKTRIRNVFTGVGIGGAGAGAGGATYWDSIRHFFTGG